MRQPAGLVCSRVVFGAVQRRTMSHTGLDIAGATTDGFILFENGVRRKPRALPWVVMADHTSACPGEVDPVRQGEPLFADKDMRQLWNLRRFPVMLDL